MDPRKNGGNKWSFNLDTMLNRMEIMGVKGANMLHRGFINCILLFIAWNMYSFAVNYNNYWRLRRDPNLPRQWLEEQTRPGEKDYDTERERVAREQRLAENKGDQRSKQFYQ